MVTRNDVAKLAGVSPCVVSYVINKSNYVSEAKTKAVLKAIEELHYHPNTFASTMKSGKSTRLLLVIDDIRDEMCSEIAYYMEQSATESNYSLTIVTINRGSIDNLFSMLSAKQYAGVFIFSSSVPFNESFISQLNSFAEEDIIIVLFGFMKITYQLHSSISIISAGIRESVCNAIEYLFSSTEKIAYIGNGSVQNESAPYGDGLRIAGYLDALENHGIEPSKDYILHIDDFVYPKSSYLDLDSLVDHFYSLPRSKRPEAFFTCSDTIAAKLILCLKNRGAHIPNDFRIIGFGDTFSAAISNPQISTISLPCSAISRCALNILLSRINGDEIDNQHFDLNLILRRST